MYNHDYAKRLYRGEGHFEDVWRSIIGIGADFEKVYHEYIDHVLAAIEKYSGYSWADNREDFIQIYLVADGQSFPHPMTITVQADPQSMLEDFVFQLVHRNMYVGFTDEGQKQQALQLVTDYVLADMNIKPVPEHARDLRQQPLKNYLRT